MISTRKLGLAARPRGRLFASVLPALDQRVVVDSLRGRVFVGQFRLGSARAVEPGLRRFFRVQLRSLVALDVELFEAGEHVFLSLAERVHRLLRRLRAGGGVTDVLPPELGQFRIVGDVSAGRRPLGARGRAVELDQAAEFRGAFCEGRVLDRALANEGEAGVALLHVHRLRRDELRIEPGGLCAIGRSRCHQRPRAGVLIAELLALFPVGAVRRRGHPPFRRTVGIEDRETFLDHVGGEGGVPEHLLGDLALRRDRTGLREGHALGCGRRELLEPVDVFGDGIDRGGAVGVATARNAGADGTRGVVNADAPFIDGEAVGMAVCLVAIAGHGEPRVGEAPAERRVLLAVVHVAVDGLAVDHAAGEEFGDVFVGGPVDRDAEVVAVLRLEVGLVLRVGEPVIAEPVEVCELLVGQLVELAVGRGGEARADEIRDVERRAGDGLALAGHPVGEVADLLVAPVRADQVAVVDVGVVDVLARLHLLFELGDDIALPDQLVRDLDAGDGAEGGREDAGFIFVR